MVKISVHNWLPSRKKAQLQNAAIFAVDVSD
jgi:hypothetical protein